LNAFGWLDGEENLVDGAENLVDLADGSLVLKIYRRVEVRNLGVYALAHNLSLASMHKLAHL
jgi:hypothetical protein